MVPSATDCVLFDSLARGPIFTPEEAGFFDLRDL